MIAYPRPLRGGQGCPPRPNPRRLHLAQRLHDYLIARGKVLLTEPAVAEVRRATGLAPHQIDTALDDLHDWRLVDLRLAGEILVVDPWPDSPTQAAPARRARPALPRLDGRDNR